MNEPAKQLQVDILVDLIKKGEIIEIENCNPDNRCMTVGQSLDQIRKGKFTSKPKDSK